jgi:hypothetical protein
MTALKISRMSLTVGTDADDPDHHQLIITTEIAKITEQPASIGAKKCLTASRELCIGVPFVFYVGC